MTKRRWYEAYSPKDTPQTERLPGRSDQVRNDAGGFVWQVTPWDRLRRFVVLGSENGTYYVNEMELTRRNARNVERCLKEDGPRTVEEIVAINQAGRAPKYDPALFALAMAASPTFADVETRRMAFAALPSVANYTTPLFRFLNFADQFRGWGRAMHDGVGRWYNERSAEDVAFQAVKYRSRDGWTHRDVLRKARPMPPTKEHDAVYRWITQREVGENVPWPILAFEEIQAAKTERQVLQVLDKYPRLPWETLPDQFKNAPAVWEALLPRLPAWALVRNLGRMTAYGLLSPLSDAARLVADKLEDQGFMRRQHPIRVLVALMTYRLGYGVRSQKRRGSNRQPLRWNPVPQVIDALDAAFYAGFGRVEPIGRPIVLALDTSGSMAGAASVMGVPGLTPRKMAAALALVTANVEDQYAIVGFDINLHELPISPRMRLGDAVNALPITRCATDASLPMTWAAVNEVQTDGFVLYTDNETWAGPRHPSQALDEYRRLVRPAKLASVAMTSTRFSVADPEDAGQMDVVGFDAATPNLVSDFMR